VTADQTEPLDSRAGQAVYSRWTLQLYDLYVLGLSCRLAWRCPAGATTAWAPRSSTSTTAGDLQ
jgi:hypothetical protein